jgi:hypothetical protein
MDTLCELSVNTRRKKCKGLVNERYKISEDWVLILVKSLDSNGVGVNRKEKGVILWMMSTKSLIVGMFPTKPFDSNMLGKPCPISTIIGNIILRYNS